MTLDHRIYGDAAACLGAIARAAARHQSIRALAVAVGVALDADVTVLAAEATTDPRDLVLRDEGSTLAVVRFGPRRAAALEDASFRAALSDVLTAAFVHRARLARVADVSREAHRARRALHAHVRSLEGDAGFVAASPAMREVAQRIDVLGPVPTNVLLLGETGTGKELVARRIHAAGRAGEPFVAVNCGALPESLVESELFGHEAGAFTGAARRRRGRFELAGRGTLFLDEIGELSLASQARLLRALQERVVEPLGSERPVPVACRVIAATHRDLGEMVARGAFREDLYYRIATYPITIPPLRARPLDIPILVRAKLATLAQRLGRETPSVSAATLRALCARPYPGNVRELENLLERALLASGDRLVIPDDAPTSTSTRLSSPSAGPPTFAQATRAILEDALLATQGKIYGADGAAARLGLRPSTLQTKLARYGVSRDRFTR